MSLGRIILLALLLAVGPAAAQPRAIVAAGAWARPAAGGMNGAAYLTLVNRGAAPDALVSASSRIAARVALHESAMRGSMAMMRPLAEIPLPAHGQARLAPGGRHLMLENLKAPLKPGERIAITLNFRHAPAQTVVFAVGEGPPKERR